MKKISIITVNLNDAEGLIRTIESIHRQQYQQLEFIIIDGNSTDGSAQVIRNNAARCTHFVIEPDTGIYNAMNKGIALATGEYLLFMNSGDELINDPDILSFCEAKLIEDIVAFDCFLVKNGQVSGRRQHNEYPTLYYVYKHGLKHQSTFIKRSLFDKLGYYNEAYRIAADYEFWLRCLLNPETTIRAYQVPVALFHLGGISQRTDWSKEHQIIHKAILPHLLVDLQLLETIPENPGILLRLITKVQKLLSNLR